MAEKNLKNAFVFYDGNNFYHNVKQMGIIPGDINFSTISESVCSHFNCNHKKSFYYNSVPSIKDGEKMYYRHMSFMSGIEKLPNFTVIPRKLQRHSNAEVLLEKKEILDSLGLCDKCKPVVVANCYNCIGNVKKREKGIDVMIAIDMLKLSVIDNKCECCVLISGDADFIPVLEMIKKNKKDVFSAFIPRGYSYELRQTIPFFVINDDLLYSCLKNK